MTTLIYIYSAGHSGSTLLSTQLGKQADMFDAGEIGFLWKRQFCSCGATQVVDCSFWKSVDDYLINSSGKCLKDFAKRTESIDPNDAEKLIRIISLQSKSSFVIDASKDYKRFKKLVAHTKFEIIPIILVAKAPKIVYSMKGKIPYTKYALRLNRLGLRMWSVAFAKRNKYGPIVISYEELSTAPKQTLNYIMNNLEIPIPDDIELTPNSGDQAHAIAGNQGFRTTNTIQTDHRWKTGLSTRERVLISTLSLPYTILTKVLIKVSRCVSRKPLDKQIINLNKAEK